MKVELELPRLPDGWGDDVEFGYGKAPSGAILLVKGRWTESQGLGDGWIYAVKPWVPAIVTAGVLLPGWVVIDEDGTWWFSEEGPIFDDDSREWCFSVNANRLHVRETPQITGEKAIWRIK